MLYGSLRLPLLDSYKFITRDGSLSLTSRHSTFFLFIKFSGLVVVAVLVVDSSLAGTL